MSAERTTTPKIVIVGGGSRQWAPTLLADLANTPSLERATIVLEDVDSSRLPRVFDYAEKVVAQRAPGWRVEATTDLDAALDGADFVVTNITTGGFDSMRHDLEVPARYGVMQPVGDSVGPGGIARSLRNIPVFVDLAHRMEQRCPDAWLLNLTNPMTTLCRAITRETSIRTIGLCHEVSIGSFFMALLLDVPPTAIDPVVTGVNHLPIVTELRVDGRNRLDELLSIIDDDTELDRPIADVWSRVLTHAASVPGAFTRAAPADGQWTKRSIADQHRVKLEVLRRFGALPLAGDRHVAEFFAGFITETSEWGRAWGIELTSIADRVAGEQRYVDDLEARLAPGAPVTDRRSTEMLAPVIDALVGGADTDGRSAFTGPLNIPNVGQCVDLPEGRVVESICVVDVDGVRPRDVVRAPAALAQQIQRISTSQELTVEAAQRGDRDLVVGAMMADPLAGSLDHRQLLRMTDELLAATQPWLDGFA